MSNRSNDLLRMGRLLAITILALAVACGSGTMGPRASVTGTWHLRSVYGSPLPYDLGYGVITAGDDLSLNSDGTYTELWHRQSPAFYNQLDPTSYPSDTVYRTSGSWSLNDTTLALIERDSESPVVGSWGDSVLVLGASLYRR